VLVTSTYRDDPAVLVVEAREIMPPLIFDCPTTLGSSPCDRCEPTSGLLCGR
jgi:hypothetical protein